MITYEQAKKSILRFDKSVDEAFDYGNAYFFYSTSKSQLDESGYIIMKDNGEFIAYPEYIHTKGVGKKPVKIPF